MEAKLYKFKFAIVGTGESPASISVAENSLEKAVEKVKRVAGLAWPSNEVCLSSVTPNE